MQNYKTRVELPTGCLIVIFAIMFTVVLIACTVYLKYEYVTDLYCQMNNRQDVVKHKACKKQDLVEMLKKDMRE